MAVYFVNAKFNISKTQILFIQTNFLKSQKTQTALKLACEIEVLDRIKLFM